MIHSSKWFTDKHIRGGYSFRSMKTERMDVKSEDLADPITTGSCKPVSILVKYYISNLQENLTNSIKYTY